jgi:hypothetical protein
MMTRDAAIEGSIDEMVKRTVFMNILEPTLQIALNFEFFLVYYLNALYILVFPVCSY